MEKTRLMTRPRFAPNSTVSFRVKNRSGKKRLAAYLASRLGVPENWAEGLLRDGHVSLDGRPAGPEHGINLSAGPHDLEVRFPEAWPRHMAATEMPLDVLYEDESLVALNKPPGVVVHPARGHLDNQTLQNGVRYRYRHLLARPDACIGPPHRLDKDTSGVILFALARPAYIHLAGQFSRGAPHKEYWAVLDGTPDFYSLVCDAPIGPDPAAKGLGTVLPPSQGGKHARTDFQVLETGDGWAVVRAVPHTGRPHQIRIHAASLGCPVAGDADYNPAPRRLGFPRQALHARRLAFVHPADGAAMALVAEPAGDLLAALARIRSGPPSAIAP